MKELAVGFIVIITIVGLMVIHEAGRLYAATQIEIAKIQAGCKP